MKNLDFPVSAAAVHLHGREFHAQDFFDVSSAPATLAADNHGGAGGARERDDETVGYDVHRERRLSTWARFRAVLRWTLVCVALALAAAVTMSWLAHSDLHYGKWSNSQNGVAVAGKR